MPTQLDIILVLAVVSWLGAIMLAWNKGASDFDTGEFIARALVVSTIIGFLIIWPW